MKKTGRFYRPVFFCVVNLQRELLSRLLDALDLDDPFDAVYLHVVTAKQSLGYCHFGLRYGAARLVVPEVIIRLPPHLTIIKRKYRFSGPAVEVTDKPGLE